MAAKKSITEQLPDHCLLTDRQVLELTGLTRRQRLGMERSGKFPKAIHVNHKTIRYHAKRVTAWIEERAP